MKHIILLIFLTNITYPNDNLFTGLYMSKTKTSIFNNILEHISIQKWILWIKGVWSDHLWINPSKWSEFFSHYACEILRVIDVAYKSYKRKRSESSVTTIITIH